MNDDLTIVSQGTPPVNWDKFMGNNHYDASQSPIHRGGCVRFADHIGKPLSDWLWENLIEMLHISRLRVSIWRL